MDRKIKSLAGKLTCVVTLTLVSFALCGCIAFLAGAGAGAGTAIWLKGSLKDKIDAPLDQVHEATQKALTDLELPVLKDKKDAMTAKIASKFSDGKRISIHLESKGRSTTEISIRVGPIGNERRSQRILSQIRKNLR